MKFVDLFAGLGGFHLALKRNGHKCVFASEINLTLSELYEKNFGIKVHGDITKINEKEIPPHDILCAGFPCQPFSKAGRQKGLNDKKNGCFFISDVARILEYHKPKYFILENVPHLKKHDREKTWNIIINKLQSLNYNVKEAILSPHEFGVPQIRKRIFIVGSKYNLEYFSFPEPTKNSNLDIKNILDKNPKSVKKLSKNQIECLEMWQNIINAIPKEDKLPSFPIWSMEFGATYPFEETTPFACNEDELSKHKGVFGVSLRGLSKKEQFELLPSYARTIQKKFPHWKIKFIMQNRSFFDKYRDNLKPFLDKLRKLPPSWQKLEWNCLNGNRTIKNYIIQFRASGIRIKRTNYAPTLVVTTTQRPIVGWENRYITPKEAARLQSVESIKLPEHESTAFRALGNAANSKIISLICLRLIR